MYVYIHDLYTDVYPITKRCDGEHRYVYKYMFWLNVQLRFFSCSKHSEEGKQNGNLHIEVKSNSKQDKLNTEHRANADTQPCKWELKMRI